MTDTKKVLIICDLFPPNFAPRMGYLCKYLPEYGWEPVVVSEYDTSLIYSGLAEENINVTLVNYYQSENSFKKKLKYTFVFVADYLFNYKDIVMTKVAQKQIKKHNISLILASSYRTFPIRTAYKLSKKYNLPLVVDLRDIIEQFPNNEHISKKIPHFDFLNKIISYLITKKIFRQRNDVIPKSDCLTTVSEFHVETLKKYNKRVNLIYNGYDPELFYFEVKKAQTFNIVYTGKITSVEMEDPTFLFEAVNELSKKKAITSQTLKIQFYTTDKTKKIISEFARKYRIEEYVDCYDIVNFSAVPDILHEASILLLLTNRHETGSRGIMTTKYFEYLAVEKPILCIRNDEDCLEKSINQTQSGVAASNVKQVTNFVLEKYAEWQQNGYTHQQVNKSAVQKFSRKNQAKEFTSLFEDLLPK